MVRGTARRKKEKCESLCRGKDFCHSFAKLKGPSSLVRKRDCGCQVEVGSRLEAPRNDCGWRRWCRAYGVALSEDDYADGAVWLVR